MSAGEVRKPKAEGRKKAEVRKPKRGNGLGAVPSHQPCSNGRQSAPSSPKGDQSRLTSAATVEGVQARCLLLGLGNDVLCDDAIGLRVAAAIRERLDEGGKVAVAETPEMGLALLDLIVGFDELILVDAVQTCQAPPGFVHELEMAGLQVLPTISPHALGIGEVMALGHALGLAVPTRVKIFAVEVEDPFSVATEMTPTLQARLPGIVERILQFIRRRS